MVARSSRKAAALLAVGGLLAAAASGCGSASRATQAGTRLQREDLIAAARALSQAQPEVAREVAATKAAWPAVANGLPTAAGGQTGARIAAAQRSATALSTPVLFREGHAQGLTGASSSLAGTFDSYVGLSGTGWRLIEASLAKSAAGGAAAAFARANAPLYIESVYDGHFGLSQIGKKLLAGYEDLGGPAAFGNALGKAEVERLAAFYSEPAVRLHPRAGVKLGS